MPIPTHVWGQLFYIIRKSLLLTGHGRPVWPMKDKKGEVMESGTYECTTEERRWAFGLNFASFVWRGAPLLNNFSNAERVVFQSKRVLFEGARIGFSRTFVFCTLIEGYYWSTEQQPGFSLTPTRSVTAPCQQVAVYGSTPPPNTTPGGHSNSLVYHTCSTCDTYFDSQMALASSNTALQANVL